MHSSFNTHSTDNTNNTGNLVIESNLSPLARPFIPRILLDSMTGLTDQSYNNQIAQNNFSSYNKARVLAERKLSSLSRKKQSIQSIDKLTILHQNMQGITNKIANLELFLSELHSKYALVPDILCFSETHLKKNNASCYNILGYVNIISYFRPTREKGGVSIFTKSNFQFEPLKLNVEPVELSFEYVGIRSRKLDLAVICVYRSNNQESDISIFYDTLEKILQKICKIKYIAICGDFNINLLQNTPEKSKFLDFLKTFHIRPTVYSITRSQSGTCLDNILVNFPKQIITNKDVNIFNGLGDHGLAQIISFPIDKKKNGVEKILTRSFTAPKIEKFKESLAKANFSQVYASHDVNEKVSLFYSIILPLLNHFFSHQVNHTQRQ